jgi:hypothetical protein
VGGPSVITDLDYRTDGRSLATITAVADAQPDRVTYTLSRFLTQLRDLRIEAEELDAVRAIEIAKLREPDIEATLLPLRAVDQLARFAYRTTAEFIADLTAVTADDLREVARSAHRSALLMVPDSIARPPVGFEAAPACSRSSVTGKRYRSRSDYRVALVHGADGMSLTTPEGPATVLFDECAAVLRFDDGARHLFGSDGMRVAAEPNLFPISPAILATIDNAVSAAVIVDMPPRDPGSVPKPSPMKKFASLVASPLGAIVVCSGLLFVFIAGVATTLAAMDEPGFGSALLIEVPLAVALCAVFAIRSRR